METIKKILRVDRREICFLKFIFEAYEGIATITTVDAHKGIVSLQIAPGCEDEAEALLRDLEKNIMIDDFKRSRKTMFGGRR